MDGHELVDRDLFGLFHFRFGDMHLQNAILEIGLDIFGINPFRQCENTLEFSVSSFAPVIILTLSFTFHRPIAFKRQYPVLNIDRNILFFRFQAARLRVAH